MNPQSFHTQFHLTNIFTVPDTSIDDDPGPAILNGVSCEVITEHCSPHGSLRVDNEHTTVSGLLESRAHQRVVFEATDRRNGPRKTNYTTEILKTVRGTYDLELARGGRVVDSRRMVDIAQI